MKGEHWVALYPELGPGTWRALTRLADGAAVAPRKIMSSTNPRMLRPKFYLARRDTRWDPYPAQEPIEVVAHDWNGFWAYDRKAGWFKTPTSYNLQREISKLEADSLFGSAGNASQL